MSDETQNSGSDDPNLELFSEKTFRLILRLPEIQPEALENAVREVVEDESFEDVDVTNFSREASHAEFEGEFQTNPIEGGVSRDVNGITVLTLRGIVYVETAVDFLNELNNLLRIETLEDAAERLDEFDAQEVPLEKIL